MKIMLNGGQLEEAIVEWLRKYGYINGKSVPELEAVVPHHATLQPLTYDIYDLEVQVTG